MITWKRIESGYYQLLDNGAPQNIYIERVETETKNGKPKLWSWRSGTSKGWDGIFERDTLREMKRFIEARYHDGTY